MKLITSILIFLVISTTVFAQTDPKTGYTNVEFLISKLPDVKKISDELEKQKKQYEVVIQSKTKDLQEKYASYQKAGVSMPELIRKDKEKELQTMQTSLQELQQNAEKDLSGKQSQLIQPLYVKVYAAIQAVAEENGYKFIFNTGDSNQVRNLIVAPADGDVSDLILKKLGTTAAIEQVKAKEEKKSEAKKEEKAPVKATTSTSPAKTPAKPVAKPVKKK
jgi:outer membrane protein